MATQVIVQPADTEEFDVQRMCQITLHKDFPREIPLSWHPGHVGGGPNFKVGKPQRTVVLKPGKSIMLELKRAEAFFGPFSLIAELESLPHGPERQRKSEHFEHFKQYAIMNWGEFPRPANHLVDGLIELGPARFPDVSVTIIEPDETRSRPIRLRDEYGLGEYRFVDTSPKRKGALYPETRPEDHAQGAQVADALTKIAEVLSRQNAPAQPETSQKAPSAP